MKSIQEAKKTLFSKNFYVVFIILFSVVLPACNCPGIHLAADARTGKYLGVVTAETRDFESKEVLSYIVQIDDGKSIEKLPQEITIYEP